MTKRGAIKIIREAIEDMSHLDKEVMMKCLKKQEYTEIISHFIRIPEIPPVRYFKECLSLFEQIPMDVLHPLFIKTLKKRKRSGTDYLKEAAPYHLKCLLINLGYDKNHYNKLNTYLETKLCDYELLPVSKRKTI